MAADTHAELLVEHLRLATGCELPVVAEDAPTSGDILLRQAADPALGVAAHPRP